MLETDLELLRPLIPNVQVTDPQLFRGGQPLEAAWPLLANAGVKLVVNLRNDPVPDEEIDVLHFGMRYLASPMNGWGRPGPLQVDSIVDRIAQEISRNQPVFVHCQHGDDRTGTIIACYRIRIQGWTNQEALREAENLHMSWVEILMRDFIEDYGKKED